MSKLIIHKREKGDLNLQLNTNELGFICRDFDIFKKLISILSELLTDLTFNFTEEGLNFNCMDSSHISYIKSEFPFDFFEEYQFTSNKIYCLPMKTLHKIFSTTKSTMDLKMVFHEDCVDIEFNDLDITKYYEVKLLDNLCDSLEISDSDDYNKIILESKNFHQICKEINDIGDTINIKTNKNSKKISFESEGLLTKIRIEKDNWEIMKNNIDISADVNYLLTFSKCCSFSNKVSLKIAEDLPIKILFELIRDANITFYLSPKIND